MFAGVCYWFPKVTGKMLDERLGKLQFWLFTIGFNVTFLPMHILGFLGMPRRIYTYQPGRGWEMTNMIATAGAFIQAIAIALMAWNIVRSLRNGVIAGDDPWDAWTLEWTTSSPPPEYNFETIPAVRSSRPLWDLKHPQDPDWQYE
jgi:cytochrome c oxidase subunit 1